VIEAGRSTGQCRVCGSTAITPRGKAEFYVGYAVPIFDCRKCGCRYAPHDSSAHDLLYEEADSRYSCYLDLSAVTKLLFDRGDLTGLRAELSKTPKYSFVIRELAHQPASARCLEIGCSRGHLTSLLILENRDVLAVDVAPRAVGAANAAFGDHFAVVGDSRIEGRAPYDFIYHVGTIGCVEDPIGLTHDLLRLLKSGGRLVFNAPNLDACALRDQLWLDWAPPPDLVTLFRPGFWREQFGNIAEVNEEIEWEPPQRNLVIGLGRLMGRRWKEPPPLALKESKRLSLPPLTWGDLQWRHVESVVRRIGAWTRIDRLVPARPADFGLLVTMAKR
jgi:SAM-dependent methyltransferase